MKKGLLTMLLIAFALTVFLASCNTGGVKKTVPDAPQAFHAEVGDGNVMLTWKAPENDGGSAIKRYEVTHDKINEWVTAETLAHTFINLTNGTTYTFKVRAVNRKGNSVEATISATPQRIEPTVPSAPQNLVANSADSGCVILSWAPPLPGSSEITAYEVRVGSEPWIETVLLTYTFRGLTNGTEYTFTVRAKNAIGYGPEAEVRCTPQNPVPFAPRNITAVVYSQKVKVFWEMPFSSGKSDIQHFEVTCNNWSTTKTTEVLSYTFAGLANGSEYTFRVRAVNSYGRSPEAVVTATPNADAKENKIVYGTATAPSGDWYTHWSNNATDIAVYKLTNGYSTIASNPGGEYVPDTVTVLKGFERKEIVGYYDYDKYGYYWINCETVEYVFELNEDLKYSDGTRISAYDYAFAIMHFSSWASNSDGGSASAGYNYIGFREFSSATKSTPFSGITIHNEYKFSITIVPEYLPYYYDIVCVSVTPAPMHMWLKDCGVAIETDSYGHPKFSNAFYEAGNKRLIEETRDHTRFGTWTNGGFIGSGPYKLISFDINSLDIVLEINPNYLGDYRGVVPSIDRIEIKTVSPFAPIDSLKNKEIDVFNATSGADIISGNTLVNENSDYNYASYLRNGYGKATFICDYGPTQFIEVRRAIAYLIDRHEFAMTYTSGYGSVVHGPYGLGMWMYQGNVRLVQDINKYNYSVTTANNILNEGGWNLDSNGNSWSGTGMRYKDITNTKVDGPWLEDQYGNVAQDEFGNRIQTFVPVNIFGYESRVKTVGGRTLMPLELDFIGTDTPFAYLFVDTLYNIETKGCGIKFNSSYIDFCELQLRLYRTGGYDYPSFSMTVLGTNFQALYDVSHMWSGFSYFIEAGSNLSRIYDLGEGGLDDLSIRMVYDCKPYERDKYLDLWTDYVLRFNEVLPELPLYSNLYYTFYDAKLKNFAPSLLWEFERAILDAYIV